MLSDWTCFVVVVFLLVRSLVHSRHIWWKTIATSIYIRVYFDKKEEEPTSLPMNILIRHWKRDNEVSDFSSLSLSRRLLLLKLREEVREEHLFVGSNILCVCDYIYTYIYMYASHKRRVSMRVRWREERRKKKEWILCHYVSLWFICFIGVAMQMDEIDSSTVTLTKTFLLHWLIVSRISILYLSIKNGELVIVID